MNPALRFAKLASNLAEPAALPRRQADAAPATRKRSAGLAGVARATSDNAQEMSAEGNVQAHPDVDALVEAICAQGCKVVYQVIASLQAGEELLETAHLDTPAVTALLTELESIMAVYAENGSVCLNKDK